MSNILPNKSCFIISETSTPTSAEIARAYYPSTIKVEMESLSSENSGRALDGSMSIEWIYHNIRKIEIGMPPFSTINGKWSVSDASTLLALVQGQIYYITYFDTYSNAERTTQVYTSNSSYDCYNGVINSGTWQSLAFNAIELRGV